MNLIEKKDLYNYRSLLLKRLKLIISFINDILRRLKVDKQGGTDLLKDDTISNKSLTIIISIKRTLIKDVSESISSLYTNITRV